MAGFMNLATALRENVFHPFAKSQLRMTSLTALAALGLIAGTNPTNSFPSFALYQPWPESVAQEVETLRLGIFPTIVVLTVNDLRFLGMQLQPTLLQPCPDPLQNAHSLRMAHAVDQNVIGITLEGDIREGSRHPLVERMCMNRLARTGLMTPP